MAPNSEQNKQELENDIISKNKALEALKLQTLSDNEKKLQEEKIRKEIEVLQKKLDELKNLESKNAVSTSNKNVKELKTQVDIEVEKSEWTYELIQGTEMEKKLKEAGKSDLEIKEFANKIDHVVRKFYDKELVGFPKSIVNSMCVGTQFAMMEALTSQGASSAEFFDATATGLSEGGLNGFLDKITHAISSVTAVASKVLGPLAGGGAFADLAKKVQNMTSYLVMNKDQMLASGSVPELVNPYKFKKLFENDVWKDTANFDKPETLALFTLNSTEGSQMSEEEKKKIQDIANNPNLKLSKKTLESVEKALATADKFLDKRSFWQDKFAGVFDMIRKPLAALGVNLLPSDILGKGFLGTALGVTTLDAMYLKPKATVKKTPDNKAPEVVNKEELKRNIKTELKKYKSPLTADMVIAASKKYSVPTEYLMAFMKNDSGYGTTGLAVETHNPGNVGNTGKAKNYLSDWEEGVNILGENLKSRIDAYQKKFGKDKIPSIKELATGKNGSGREFFGVYMTASEGPKNVQDMEKDLVQAGISNKDELLATS